MPDLKAIDEIRERVETGPVRIGDDWAGVFIRGDDALHYAYVVRMAAKVVVGNDPLGASVLSGLADTLSSCMEPCEATPLNRALREREAE